MARNTALPRDATDSNQAIAFPPFRLDVRDQRLWRGEHCIPLKPKALAILKYLLDRPGQLVTREDLRARFWGSVHLSEGVLKAQIAELRQALGDSAREPRFIETAHRLGYRFIGRIDQCSERSPSPSPSARASASPAIPETPLRPHYFAGRELELEFLLKRWALASAGERQVIFVTGEAGIGKTLLVQTFLEHLHDAAPEALVTWGQCIDQYGSAEAYLPIIEALRRACMGPENAAIGQCLRENAPAWLGVIPALQVVSPAAASESPVPAARMLREMAEALEALTKDRLMVLLVEDLHWADHSTIDLLAYLAQRSDPARLLVLGTFRAAEARTGRLADVADTLEARKRAAQLSLPRLSAHAIRDYLAQRFGGHRLPEALHLVIHGRSEGNALFMVGIIDQWVEQGLLVVDESGCQLRASVDELARCLPDSFVRMVERELAHSSQIERSVIEAASVAGQVFSSALVAAALHAETVQVEEVCMRWAQRGQFLGSLGQVEWNDGTVAQRFQFLHVLHQQISYEQLGAARRAHWHRRIGERLECAYAGDAESIAPELALHFQRGQDYARAVRYLRGAGERALRRSAYREAVELLSRAIGLLDKLGESEDRLRIELELLVLSLSPLRILKGYGAAELEPIYERLQKLCEGRPPTSELFIVLAGMGAFHVMRATYRSAREIGQTLLELAEQAGDADAIAEAHLLQGSAYHFLAEHRAAEEHLSKVVAFHQAGQWLGSSKLTALPHGFAARGMIALSLYLTGYPDRARREAEENSSRARASANPFALAYALLFGSGIYLQRGELDAALQSSNELVTLSDEQGFEMFGSVGRARATFVEMERGNLPYDTEALDRAWATHNATGSRAASCLWWCRVATVHRRLGRAQRALALLNEALQADPKQRDQFWDAELFRLKGELLAEEEWRHLHGGQAKRRSQAAESCLLRAIDIAVEQGAKTLELRATASLARYWRALGLPAQGKQALLEVYSWFTEGFGTADLEDAKGLLAELEQASDR